MASSGDDETIRLWDVNTGDCWKCLKYPPEKYQGGIWTIAFSRDGLYLASGGQDTTIKFWNLKTDEFKVLEGHQSWVWTVVFYPISQDERPPSLAPPHDDSQPLHPYILASGSDDQTIKIWDVQRG